MILAAIFDDAVIYKSLFSDRRALQRAFADSFVPPKTLCVPRGTFVDAASAFDELHQWLGMIFVSRGAPHNPRPFASRSCVDFDRVCGAPDNGSERVFPFGHY